MKRILLLSLLAGLCFSAQFRYDGEQRPVQTPVGYAYPGDTITLDNYELLDQTDWTFISDDYSYTWVNQNSEVLDIATTALDSFVLSNLVKGETALIRTNKQIKIYANSTTSSVAYDIIGGSASESIAIDLKELHYRKFIIENVSPDTANVTISIYKAE